MVPQKADMEICYQDHHEAEEKTLFPALELKMAGKMNKNEEQHESFLVQVRNIGIHAVLRRIAVY